MDRPVLAARIFCIKLRTLIAFVKDGKVFGDVKAYIRVIEFREGDSLTHTASFL